MSGLLRAGNGSPIWKSRAKAVSMSPFNCCKAGWRIRGDAAVCNGTGARAIRDLKAGGQAMAYIFNEDELPRLLSNGRERVFFVNKELTKIDDMLAGIMHYKQGASSPYHLHKNCEHFYFIMEGKATVQTEEGTREIGPGTMVFIPAEEKHRLRALEPLFYFEFQAPNRFQTTILEGTPDDLKFRSSMTLFARAAPDEPLFRNALAKYFGGKDDPATLGRI
jgi:mannose-6-phosphate isomerase-like protein (cupin superfamily)